MHASFSLLYVIAIIVFVLIKSLLDSNKKKDKDKVRKEIDVLRRKNAQSHHWGDTSSQEEAKTTTTRSSYRPKKVVPQPSKVFIEDARDEGLPSTVPAAATVIVAPVVEEPKEDYTFHNIEEVKKAIIWSEIINRKY